MRIRLLMLLGPFLIGLGLTGCASIGQTPPASPGMQDTEQQARADLERELSLYSD